MSAEEIKALLCRFLDEAYNKGNLAVGDGLLASRVVFHTPDADIEGTEGWKQYASSFLNGFSDLVVSVEIPSPKEIRL